MSKAIFEGAELIEQPAEELALVVDDQTTFAMVKATVAGFVEADKEKVFDIETNEGEKEARSYLAKWRKTKKPVSDIYKRESATLRQQVADLKASEKEVTGLIQGVIDRRNKPLEEKKERLKAEEHEAWKVERVAACWDEAHLANKTFDQEKEIAALKAKEEAERAEKERLEREENIRKEAAQQAKLVAEAKAKEEKEAAERAVKQAEEDKRLAEELARQAEEKAKADAEAKAKYEADQREIKRVNKEIAEKKARDLKAADLENQKRRNNAALDALCNYADRDAAIAILTAIVKGQIPFVSIDYVGSAIGNHVDKFR